jgi:hypothetical protein
MKLTNTLKTLRQVSSVSLRGFEPDEALLLGDVVLVLRILKLEIRSLPDDEELEPVTLLALSKFHQSIGDETRALALFRRAASFDDQNRGYYTDVGFCSSELCRASANEEFCAGIKESINELLKICPFREDLERALGSNS